jgi:hypothetical protein
MSMTRLFINIFVTVTISLAASLAGALLVFSSCMALHYLEPGSSLSAYLVSTLRVYTPQAQLLIGLGSPTVGLHAAVLGTLGVYIWRKTKGASIPQPVVNTP